MNKYDLSSRLFLISAFTIVIQLFFKYNDHESAAFGLVSATLALILYVEYLKERKNDNL